MGRAAGATALCALLAAAALAGENDEPVPAELMPPGGDVIPPGNDELFAQMLGSGAKLPNNCVFSEGMVDYTTVKVTYDCPWGPVVFELTHPDQAAAKAIHTERFAVTQLSGSVPDGLTDSVVGLIRQYEGGFEWERGENTAAFDVSASVEQ